MSKIQGKQIADSTIEQSKLNLTTPTSGDTMSGATVQYVNQYVSELSGSTVIGAAEDGSYTDGIFTDFTPNTRVGVAIDRFNEMFLKLAPTPPSSWALANVSSPSPVLSTATITARMIGTGTSTSGIVTSTLSPSFTISSLVGMGANAKTKDGTFVFTLKDYDGSVRETKTITSSSTTDLTGIIRYNIGDPYAGVSGQAGFWTGVTGLSGVTFTSTLVAGTTARNLYFEYAGFARTGTTFYVDNTTHTPVATSLTVSGVPSMTTYISGVPTLTAGQQFTGIGFSITNVSSFFYAPINQVWNIVGTRVSSTNGDLDSIPSTSGATGTVTGKSATITAGYAESISFTVTPYNRSQVAGTTTGYTNPALRIDTVSNESSRKTSGSGSYPSTGWGGTYDSSQSLVGTYTDEMQLLNGVYQYPTTNYTVYGGPNYSTVTGTRWATFNIGTFSSHKAFTLTINGGTGISTSYGSANLLIQVKISGATSWVDANAAYDGISNPGSGADGVAAVVAGSPTAYVRRITFGSASTYSGAIMVRFGITGSGTGITFTSLSASAQA